VTSGSRTLKDALNEAMRDWVTNVDTPSTSSAPSPARTLPDDGARLPGVIGREAREQMLEQTALPDLRWSPASAAAPTPSACSIPSSTTPPSP
jgi:tryptophan synthase beta chain